MYDLLIKIVYFQLKLAVSVAVKEDVLFEVLYKFALNGFEAFWGFFVVLIINKFKIYKNNHYLTVTYPIWLNVNLFDKTTSQ